VKPVRRPRRRFSGAFMTMPGESATGGDQKPWQACGDLARMAAWVPRPDRDRDRGPAL